MLSMEEMALYLAGALILVFILWILLETLTKYLWYCQDQAYRKRDQAYWKGLFKKHFGADPKELRSPGDENRLLDLVNLMAQALCDAAIEQERLQAFGRPESSDSLDDRLRAISYEVTSLKQDYNNALRAVDCFFPQLTPQIEDWKTIERYRENRLLLERARRKDR